MQHKPFAHRDRDWQSLAAPAVLILTGLLLVIGELLGIVSVVRIENLWPMAVLLIGLSELSPDLARNGQEKRGNGPR
ncbi:MAG: hypothetical protein JO270_04770 [Acidobacteriaceae bacterium]|nr:hypothetical protein [Acidobacteriaceae bacterium]MBV8572940.1 hypothetical protein [Acidobacteriaceae bacterium]